ncbi:hypothetical protein JSY14_05855 [Brachybacterium sp. EF45031]|uniref:hypothetical protein n=1 Tax=Brachybacterium sillae TaxID=2810536 RepID=UPI00217D8702|nr:hypothetical protein [Brachybacterium sillae]MCS6711573.1 hypothetical protein [Brachybacterium sillae]
MVGSGTGAEAPWQGTLPTCLVDAVEETGSRLAPPGTLRVVVQRLRLTERGRPVGVHWQAGAIADVDGNLVPVELTALFDRAGDEDLLDALEVGAQQLLRDLAGQGLEAVDVLRLTRDWRRDPVAHLRWGVEIGPEEIGAVPRPDALYDPALDLRLNAPDLEALQDARRAACCSWTRRLRNWVRDALPWGR